MENLSSEHNGLGFVSTFSSPGTGNGMTSTLVEESFDSGFSSIPNSSHLEDIC